MIQNTYALVWSKQTGIVKFSKLYYNTKEDLNVKDIIGERNSENQGSRRGINRVYNE